MGQLGQPHLGDATALTRVDVGGPAHSRAGPPVRLRGDTATPAEKRLAGGTTES
jgi:hypothetical protein